VYRDFTLAQKCWAHLLRKAIKLTLLQPDNQEYRTFLTGLLELYRKACRLKQDRRLKPATRKKRVLALEDDLWALCGERYKDQAPPPTDAEHDFVNLVNELMRLMEASELFTFVIHPEAPGTNNEAERSLRDAASDRKTGRTSKTIRGARRRTVLTSVLESLRLSLPDFTLSHVLKEVTTWLIHRSQPIPTTAGIAKPAPAREFDSRRPPALNRHLTRAAGLTRTSRDRPPHNDCRHTRLKPARLNHQAVASRCAEANEEWTPTHGTREPWSALRTSRAAQRQHGCPGISRKLE